MENLNSSSAFQGPDNHISTGGGRFPTLPLSGFTFTPNSPTSPSGHLAVPSSPAAFSSQTVPRNPRVVPMITRSQSSCNLPENLAENPYDEVGGGLSSHTNHRVPKKSCSQWDMVGASTKNNHLQVGRPQTDVTVMCVFHTAEGWVLICVFVARQLLPVLSWFMLYWRAVGCPPQTVQRTKLLFTSLRDEDEESKPHTQLQIQLFLRPSLILISTKQSEWMKICQANPPPVDDVE